MTKLEEIVLEHTRLAKEFSQLPTNGGDTPEEAALIEKRKVQIKARIEALREDRRKYDE